MKKYIIFTAVLVAATLIAAADDQMLMEALKGCSHYVSSGSLTTDGVQANSKGEIVGWEKDKCVYKEAINFSGVNANIMCKFSKPQLDEITSVMEAYLLVQKYSGETPDTSSLDGVQTNPIVRVWNKYVQDPSVCTISTE